MAVPPRLEDGMAERAPTHIREDHVPASYDGTPRCALCSDADPEHEHTWCCVARSLVCGDCCRGVAGFEPGPLIAALTCSEHVMTPREIVEACRLCPHSPSSRDVQGDGAFTC